MSAELIASFQAITGLSDQTKCKKFINDAHGNLEVRVLFLYILIHISIVATFPCQRNLIYKNLLWILREKFNNNLLMRSYLLTYLQQLALSNYFDSGANPPEDLHPSVFQSAPIQVILPYNILIATHYCTIIRRVCQEFDELRFFTFFTYNPELTKNFVKSQF